MNQTLKPISPLLRCTLHHALVIPGHACPVCLEEREKGLRAGSIQGPRLRPERKEVVQP